MKPVKYIALFILAFLLSACGREAKSVIPEEPQGGQFTATIPYKVKVSESTSTKAGLDGNRRYVFAEGDRLFVNCIEGGTAKMYGYLGITYGIGGHEAVFEGYLHCIAGFTPKDDSALQATLMSANDAIHSVTAGKVTTSYPTTSLGGDFSDAVSKFGDFTGNGTYEGKSFVLSQHSAFLLFNITMDDNVSVGMFVPVKLQNGETTISSSVPAQKANGSVQLIFSAAFKQGTQLDNASLTVTPEGEGGTHFLLGNQQLAANYYYTISRSMLPLEYFTVQAIEAGTVITFNYATSGNGVQYSTDGGSNWTAYSTAVTLANADDRVCFRGRGNSYQMANGKQLFTVNDNKPCYVYGDLMSLMYTDESYTTKKTAVPNNAFKQTFKGATWIRTTSAKKILLPAETLGTNCYEEMFYGCTGLTECSVEHLPAATLSTSCYRLMFQGCSNMQNAPNLTPETGTLTLAETCYDQMFRACSSLLDAPSLPATTLAQSCYYQMFYGCSSLRQAPPELPAKSLPQSCYYQMFYGCTSLTTGPTMSDDEDPITSVSNRSCAEMFRGCTSLTSVGAYFRAPMAESCYQSMFQGCSRLTNAAAFQLLVPAGGVEWKNSCNSLFSGCVALENARVTFPDGVLKDNCYREMFSGCTNLKQNYMDSSFNLGTITSVGAESCRSMFFNCSSLTKVEGTFSDVANNSYRQMFNGCSKITEVPGINLASKTEMPVEAFRQTYSGCTVLTEVAGTLGPDTGMDLQDNCFRDMFLNCSSLVSAPALPTITSVALESCRGMFYKCEKLDFDDGVRAKLAATTLAQGCYREMFRGCKLFNQVLVLPATTLAAECYYGMFYECTNLTESPVLPAPSLVSNCYREMFNGCTSLSTITCLAASGINENGSTTDWVKNVSTTGTFYKNPFVAKSVWPKYNNYGIPFSDSYPWAVDDYQDTGIIIVFPGNPFDPQTDL